MLTDRRFNERVPSDLPVRLTQLDDGVDCAGQLQDISETGICAIFNAPLTPGALVQLEILEIVVYGQIAYSNPEDDGFRTGIFVEPALLDSSNMAELVNSYLTSAGGRG